MNRPEREEKDPTKKALLAISALKARIAELEGKTREPIAVVGMACRFPGGANSPEALWSLLSEGGHGIAEIIGGRWPDAYYDPDPDAPGKISSRFAGLLRGVDVDAFDAEFFNILPAEAMEMDPQQRLLLEVAWEALENAGIAPSRLRGTKCGVFVGISTNDYGLMAGAAEKISSHWAQGNAHSVAAGRISYTLGLQGPCVALDTACSSSLVAVHLACQSLRLKESDLAIVGGVNLLLSPVPSICMSKARFLSPDGESRTFDARADGYGRGEGCGVVVLKPLFRAIASGDPIHAVIRGSAINQDGASAGLTVPSGPAQEAVIRSALQSAAIVPSEVSYVETHGTGTRLGDPIEVASLARVYCADRSADSPLVLGAIKTNLGHLEAAAGMASLIKVALALANQEIPPNRNLQALNPEIARHLDRIALPTRRLRWTSDQKPRRAGISGFAFQGSNAHVVLEAAPPRDPPRSPRRPRTAQLLCLSAKTEPALIELARSYAGLFSSGEGGDEAVDPAEVCRAAARGRDHFRERLAIPLESAADARRALESFAAKKPERTTVRGRVRDSVPPKLAFMFTGQGAQYPRMADELYRTEPVFQASIDRCAELLSGALPRPLPEVLQDAALLSRTELAQPALFAVEWSLAELLERWGLSPSAVIGHSAGEYVAACVAGVFSLEDGLCLIVERGRLMQSLPAEGEMAALFAPASEVERYLDGSRDRLVIAAANGPLNTVVSGTKDAVRDLMVRMKQAGIGGLRLPISHAAHSPMMHTIVGALVELASSIRLSEPNIELVSNVSGELVRPGEVTDPAYWGRHLAGTVRFASGMASLFSRGFRHFIELGPDPVLTGSGMAVLPDVEHWFVTLKRGKSDVRQLMESLCAIYAAGLDLAWDEIFEGGGTKSARLPNYPFTRTRYWRGEPGVPAGGTGGGGARQALEPAPIAPPDLDDRRDVERYLIERVGEITGIPRERLHAGADLIEMGMDSILVMRVLNACAKETKIAVAPRDFFARPRLDHLCDLLAARGKRPEGEADVSRDQRDRRDPYEDDLAAELPFEPLFDLESPVMRGQEPELVLLTGATGFVGVYVLAALLERTRARIACLVRAADRRDGLDRILAALEKYGLKKDGDEARIDVVAGALDRPALGLSPEAFEDLARRVDAIYHVGAAVNWVYPYASLRDANVAGTLAIIRLALWTKAKPIHFVSSMGVYPVEEPHLAPFAENEVTPYAPHVKLGYFRTKVVAERFVRAAGAKGAPVSIYRASLINGDSRSGRFDLAQGNVFADLTAGCVALGHAPKTRIVLNVVPVDFFAGAVVRLSLERESFGRAFNILNADVALDDVWRLAAELGHGSVRLEPFETWLERVRGLDLPRRSPLGAILPIFDVHPLAQFEHAPLTTILEHANARAWLDRLHLVPPPLERLLPVYLADFQRQMRR